MRDKKKQEAMGKSTRAIHIGRLKEPVFGEVSVPIFQSSTFSFPSAQVGAARFAGDEPGYIYTRLNNPTVNALEETVAAMENAYGGMAAASGMAAISTVFLALLSHGDHVVATDSLYGATRIILENELCRFGVTSTFVDTSDLDATRRAMQGGRTKMVYIETPTNPTMILTDIRKTAAIAHEAGTTLVVDNTFASPYLQRPMDLGADVVVHSLTKYVNGHSDVVGGMIVTVGADLHKRIKRTLNLFGGTADPHQAWLILRGAQTLPLRLQKAQENAGHLAEYLRGHPKVTWVRYPGLPDHPQHALAQEQMDGPGAMICFGVKNGLQGGITVMNSVRLIILAVSLGGVDSLIEHPASMTHVSIPSEEREAAGITDDLVRLSVGCEDYEDLRNDLDQALQRIP